MTSLCSDDGAFAAVGQSSVPRQLQADQSICDELKGEIEAGTTTMDIQGSCECSTISGGDTRLACRSKNACISSDGGDPMQGDFLATFTKDGDTTAYYQAITVSTCFTYPSDVYDGKKVCVSTVQDGLGTVATCEIQVGSDSCNVCRFCPINLISFDCTNLGYEDRTACGDNNTDDSILQFLYMPELVDGCSGGGGGGDSSSGASATGSPTPNPSGGASMINAMMAGFFGLVPLLFLL